MNSNGTPAGWLGSIASFAPGGAQGRWKFRLQADREKLRLPRFCSQVTLNRLAESLRQLALPKLQVLELVGKQFTEAAVADLSGLPELSQLRLAVSGVSAEGIRQVASNKSLVSVGVDYAALTPEAIASLSESNIVEMRIHVHEGDREPAAKQRPSLPRNWRFSSNVPPSVAAEPLRLVPPPPPALPPR